MKKIHKSNIVDTCRFWALNKPNKTAFIFLKDGESQRVSINYKELDCKARILATYFQEQGLTGLRALLLYQPGLEFIIAFLGCLYANVIAVPAYPPRGNQNMLRLQAIISDAQTTAVLTTASELTNIKAQLAGNLKSNTIKYIATDTIESNCLINWREPKIDNNTLAFLQYTSGSTGIPKGVMISHGNLFHNERMISQAFGHSSDTVVVGWLPVYHDMGLIGNILQPLYLGRPCIFMSPMSFLQKPIRWLQAISDYKATTSGGPNFAYDLCIEKIRPEQLENLNLSSWNLAFTGAEPVRAQTLERFARVFGKYGFRSEAFYACYGMAETTLFVSGGSNTELPIVRYVDRTKLLQNRVVFISEWEVDCKKVVGCGHSYLNQEIVIANPESMDKCGDDEVGEIWVKGDSVAQGYWQNSELTKQTFNAFLTTDEGPFLRTGDLGFLKDGELYVTGRLKDMIIIRGKNHYPQDIEQTVQNSHEALRIGHGGAFSIDLNEQEQLVIVQEVKRNYLRKLNASQIFTAICQAVAQSHGIQVYAILLIKTGSIAKTSSGKIQRYACRKGFLQNTLNIVSDWTINPNMKSSFRNIQSELNEIEQNLQSDGLLKDNVATIQTYLVNKIVEYHKANSMFIDTEKIDIQKPFSNYGLDSVALIELSSQLETWLGCEFSPTMLHEYPNIHSLAEHLNLLQTESFDARFKELSDEKINYLLQELLK